MNIRKHTIVGLVILLAGLLSGCTIERGSGNVISEARSVSNFERIDLSGSGEVVITQGAAESLTVETDDNLMQYVLTDVSGGTLHLGLRARQFNTVNPTRLKFTVQVKDLTGLDVSGSGSIMAGAIAADHLDMNVSGSGAVQIEQLTATAASVDVSGSGNVRMAGAANQVMIDIVGLGATQAGDLRAAVVDLQISGSGTATVWAVETLDANLSGSGSVSYYGNPTVNSSISGSGTVKSLGGK